MYPAFCPGSVSPYLYTKGRSTINIKKEKKKNIIQREMKLETKGPT